MYSSAPACVRLLPDGSAGIEQGATRTGVWVQHCRVNAKGNVMNGNEPFTTLEERRQVGRYFRQMLSNVEPEHVPEMLHMLYLFGHGGKPLRVPPGPWRMPMPHGYMLRGEGPVGMAIEPPPNRDGMLARPRFNTLGTAEVLALCAQARNMKRPERDAIVAQLYGLSLELCETEAVEAIELLTCYLIEA